MSSSYLCFVVKMKDSKKQQSDCPVCKHDESQREVLSCVFFDDVLCSFRKSQKPKIMARCLKCSRYKRFGREMEKEEDEFFEFCEKVWTDPQGYSEGRIR
jgi:hypothetical protein